MLKSELVQTDKHSIKILLRRKNLRFLRRTNLIKSRCTQAEKKSLHIKPAAQIAHLFFSNSLSDA